MRKILLPPLMLTLCLLGMILLHQYRTPTFFLSGEIKNLGYLVILAGIALPLWGAVIFRRRETNIIPYKSPDKMVTEGPFRFSRNPMYLGMLLVLLGAAVRLASLESLLFVLMFFAVANWWYIPFEEDKMRAVFGEEFDAYKSRVRRWI